MRLISRILAIRNRLADAYYRRQCERVGPGTRLRMPVVIEGGKAGIGRGISLGERCTVYPFCQLVTDHYDAGCGIVIGSNCHFNFNCYLSGTGGLEIGDNCLFGPGVKILTGGHNFEHLAVDIIDQGLVAGPVKIANNVWVGAGAIILPNVTVGPGAVIAAGAVVTRDVAPNSIVAGVPAKLIRFRDSSDQQTLAQHSKA